MHTISIRYTLTQIIYKFIIKKRTYEHSLFTLRVRDIDSQRERERERERERFVIYIINWFWDGLICIVIWFWARLICVRVYKI